jgi:putative sterol carrier protein
MSRNPYAILVLGLQDLSCISPDISKEEENIMTVAETFETMQKIFNPAAAAGLNKTLQWNISGEDAGQWALKIANQTCELIPGGVDKADLSLAMSDKDWIAIAEGRQDAMQAFLTGKVKATGELPLAMRLTTLFPVKR